MYDIEITIKIYLYWFIIHEYILPLDYTEAVMDAPFGIQSEYIKVPTNQERIKVSEKLRILSLEHFVHIQSNFVTKCSNNNKNILFSNILFNVQ